MRRVTTVAAGVLAMALILIGLSGVANAASWPLVQSGHKGTNVRTVQHLVTHHGFATDVDGDFGPNTKNQVTAFQRANSLDADGIVGPNTWPKLVVEVAEGSTARHAVTAAKEQLNKHGAKLTVNGTFDAATTEAVKKFQSANGLTANGVVNTSTWRELVAGAGAVGGYSLPVAKSVLPRSEYDDPHHDYPAIDLPVSSGTPVYAVNGGSATKIPNTGSCGYGVTVNAKDGGVYTYCHFRQAAVASGEVKAGQLIGYSGNTGRTSGPHLHLQIKRNGTLVCPQRLLLAIYDGKPVPSVGSLPTTGCFY
ncbi:Putative peptidoglycan binding domain-containing protein [Amycolatopsis arida]|uniref:Putative peptidoglycan binding domain-containing protein n=1 Tax=Amycolatopsis arida TaxID=587909 RepID=A0A1I5SCK3_9PSEU|nr:peptidoglycan-binding protein [Amycolatopsis arida]TDX96521.1 putative peptidoglycan binding protein [Amycolatopsis arida]SFP68450.1 Putative peptidoglycan binding domain-containing protein [Amycolatopsis arida]